MSRRSSEDEYAAMEEDEKLLLADIYPELKEKLEKSIQRSRKKRQPIRTKASAQQIPVFDLSDTDSPARKSPTKREVVEKNDDLQPDADVSVDKSKQSEDYSFHSAQSFAEEEVSPVKARSPILSSPPNSFYADEPSFDGDEMDGSFVVNPRAYVQDKDRVVSLSDSDVEPDEEPKSGSTDYSIVSGPAQVISVEDSSSSEEDDDDSERTSDEEFITEDESEMSVDRSYHADVVMTPPNRRVLPPRSTRNQLFTSTGRAILPFSSEVTPSMVIKRRDSSEESDDGSGEESFEIYLRKLREEDAKKKQQQMAEESDGEEEMEDSFVVSDESVDVIDDEYENGSGEEESESVESEDKESGDSSEDDKENRVTTKKKETREEKEEKPARKRNLVLGLADSFNSPSVRAVDRDSRDPDRHFLLSLSDNYDGKRRHADAESYLRKGVKGEKTRAAFVQRLFGIFNREIFEEKLPSDLSISFNGRLRKTAGYCKWSIRTGKCSVELSPKVCSKPDRIRDTLAHELCHAAVFVINGLVKEHHGPVWQSWTRKFSSRFRGLPVPSRCHSYDIDAKFVYECDGCGQLVKRHSKSLNTEKTGCGRCHGRFHLKEKTETNGGKKREANAFALYVKQNYGEEKRGGRSHKEIMQLLSARFKHAKSAPIERDEEDEERERDVKRLDLDMSVMSIQDEE